MAITLVVLAAGIGSRYGGLKQIDPVGEHGELIIDYSLFDAERAGFERLVFVIRPDIEADFRDAIGRRAEARFDCRYVHQTVNTALPIGVRLPPERTKPLGTAHAVLACADAVKTPFAVINADDFYGVEAFRLLADFLEIQPAEGRDYAMVAYCLNRTLSEYGTVARGICDVSPANWLRGVVEQTALEPFRNGARFRDAGDNWRSLDGDVPVSMNCWGFTPSLFPRLAERFPEFLQSLSGQPKAEFFLPTVVDGLLRQQACRVKVLKTDAQWFGVTYPADKPVVRQRVAALTDAGFYPSPLWSPTQSI